MDIKINDDYESAPLIDDMSICVKQRSKTSVYLDSSDPLYVKRFDFFFNENDQLDVTINDVETDGWNSEYTTTMTGDDREEIVRENRKKLLAHERFSEYVRFYQLVYPDSEQRMIGVMASEIMFLTLNSRFRLTKELSQANGITLIKLPVSCSFQKKPCRLLTIDDMITYITSMHARLPSRKLIKHCLVKKIIELSILK